MARARLLTGAAALLLFLWAPPGLHAQGASPDAPSIPGGLALRSLVVPGWGQREQGQRRAWIYGVAEVGFWAFWLQRRHAAAGFRDDYRDLAWSRARMSSEPRVDGPWAYYEDLSKWQRSGAFDADATRPGVQPETDPSTFNGSTWALARGLHFRGGDPSPGDPEYQAALAWYQDHAYGSAFLWDWSGKEDDQAEFKHLIDRSDARFRQATTALGLVLANHALSAVDAFVSARVPGETFMRVAPRAPWRQSSSGFSFTLSWAPPS